MTCNELKEILKEHELWLNGKEGGRRANLRGADLRCADLIGANLSRADLDEANLSCANLSNANLSYANLGNAHLNNANLSNANISCADMIGTSLNYANLHYANLNDAYLGGADLYHSCLVGANLTNADLRYANLGGAELNNAILHNVEYNAFTAFFAMACPEEGAFIGYKKANGYIVKLEICADARRSSATTRKCRCSAAKVLSITNLDGTKSGINEVSSDFDESFIYRVGEIVSVPDFCEDRWQECAEGIHFFITRDEAVRY